MAAVLIVAGYLASRHGTCDEFFEQHWEFLALTLGILALGVITTGFGVGLFYSVDFAFRSGAGLLSALVMAGGLALVVLSVTSLVFVVTGDHAPFGHLNPCSL